MDIASQQSISIVEMGMENSYGSSPMVAEVDHVEMVASGPVMSALTTLNSSAIIDGMDSSAYQPTQVFESVMPTSHSAAFLIPSCNSPRSQAEYIAMKPAIPTGDIPEIIYSYPAPVHQVVMSGESDMIIQQCVEIGDGTSTMNVQAVGDIVLIPGTNVTTVFEQGQIADTSDNPPTDTATAISITSTPSETIEVRKKGPKQQAAPKTPTKKVKIKSPKNSSPNKKVSSENKNSKSKKSTTKRGILVANSYSDFLCGKDHHFEQPSQQNQCETEDKVTLSVFRKHSVQSVCSRQDQSVKMQVLKKVHRKRQEHRVQHLRDDQDSSDKEDFCPPVSHDVCTPDSDDELDFALMIDSSMQCNMEVEVSKFECGECSTLLDSRGSLRKHIATYHSPPGQEPAEMLKKTYVCPKQACKFKTRKRDKMDAHIAVHLTEGYTPTGKKRSVSGPVQRIRYEKEEYHCPMCPYSCTIEKAFHKHLKVHAFGPKNFMVKVSCVICGKDRQSEADLKKHMRKHKTGKYFFCDICNFKTVQLKKVIQHRRMHTGEKPHLCPHCSYRAARRDNLRSHVRRMHKKENVYSDTFNPKSVLLAEVGPSAQPVS